MRSKQTRRRRRSGFTLIEALLALSLGLVLMAGTFTAIYQYAILEDRGRRQVQTAQVIQALVRDMEADLQRITNGFLDDRELSPSSKNQMVDSSIGERLLDVTSVDQQPMVFYGTSDHLVMTVSGTNARFETGDRGALTQVLWCVGNGSPQRTALRSRAGLARQTTVETDGRTGLLRFEIPFTDEAATRVTTVLQERCEVRFRYFDGNQWVKRWNSAASRQLPLAIQVRFRRDRRPDDAKWVLPVSLNRTSP